MDALTGRDKQLVRLWDRDFNLVYSGEGDVGEVLGELHLTIDQPPRDDDWRSRRGGRITNVSVAFHGEHIQL